MNAFLPVFASFGPDSLISAWSKLDSGLRENLALLAAFGSVTLLLLVWALFIRKRRRRRSHYEFPSAPAHAHSHSGEGGAQGTPRRKWRRRRRRDHRPRNPTLAETGGLPPIRAQEPPETTF